jgi:hypothetical protein
VLMLLEVLGVYFGFAIVAVYGLWRLIGRQGFVGLEDTDSPLARLFRKSNETIAGSKPATSGAGT